MTIDHRPRVDLDMEPTVSHPPQSEARVISISSALTAGVHATVTVTDFPDGSCVLRVHGATPTVSVSVEGQDGFADLMRQARDAIQSGSLMMEDAAGLLTQIVGAWGVVTTGAVAMVDLNTMTLKVVDSIGNVMPALDGRLAEAPLRRWPSIDGVLSEANELLATLGWAECVGPWLQTGYIWTLGVKSISG